MRDLLSSTKWGRGLGRGGYTYNKFGNKFGNKMAINMGRA